MSTSEKNCQWHFAPGANYTIGTTDAAGENFTDAMNSLVRECIQNSLDAVLDTTKPVKIVFDFQSMPMTNFPNFFDLRRHILSCVETFPEQAKKLYDPMLEHFDTNMVRTGARMFYLKISDFNTKGMNYDENDLSSNFGAFVRSLGVHGGDQSSSGRGGSFGLGKSTFFLMSPFRTMFVSTYSADHNYVFEGVASLATHKMNGKTLSHIGYYDNNAGNPITSFDKIPTRFVRKPDENGITQYGTDIFVMGKREAEDDEISIVQSVLLNYWLSIYKNKLVVEVKGKSGSCIVDQHSLPELMNIFYSQNTDNARNKVNPRPYYNAVTLADTSDSSTIIKEYLTHIGKVELYLIKEREAKSDRITFFRLPCMMIMRKNSSQLMLGISTYGVYGVFVCVNPVGDRLLKNLENPAHDEWNEKHWQDPITRKPKTEAISIMKELKDFLKESIEGFCKKKDQASMKMLGAGKYLYTVKDVVEHSDIEQSIPIGTFLAGEGTSTEETGMRTSDYYDSQISVPSGNTVKDGTVTNEEGQSITRSEGGSVSVLVTPPKKAKNKKTKRNKGGDTVIKGEISKDPSPASAIVPVRYKLYASAENDHIVHNLCIMVENDVPSAKIELTSRREDGRIDNELSIVSTDQGIGEEMEIRGVHLFPGNNMIRVCFNDSTKHALTITVKQK